MNQIQLQQFTCWIFDMDGTLTIAAHDFDAIRAELNIAQGKPILEAIDEMPEAMAVATAEKLHQLELEIAAESRAQPDAITLLEHLQSRDVSLSILTRNARDIAEATLDAAGIKQFFQPDRILGRDQCAPKPDPAGIQKLMTQCNASTDETIMIGDYVFDLQAGKNAGVATVHFDTDAQYPWPELTDFKVEKLSQLIHH